MTALASVAIPAAAPDKYLVEAITDELTLAKLLGWGNLPSVESGLRARFMFATCHGERGTAARLGSQPMPRWRRDWDGAGPLISLCQMDVRTEEDGGVYVVVPGDSHWISYSEHPTKDDAVRFAICKAAIGFLNAARHGAMP